MLALAQSSRTALKHPWVYRASISQLIASAAFAGLLIWLINAGLDLLWAKYNGLTAVPMGIADALLSFAFAFVVFKLMLAARARHRRIVQQLEIIAEMNHEIRNALDEIGLSVYLAHNEQLLHTIDGAMQRIQWALREVLPQTDTRDK